MRLVSPYWDFVRGSVEARLLGRRRPFLAGVKLTHRCNLRCQGCPFWRRPADDLPYDQAVPLFDRLERMGVRLAIFEGGEPFLWRDGDLRLDNLVQAAKQRFPFVGVTTNGTLSLESSADLLWVSIDGLQENHDFNRGPTFDTIMANLARSTHRRTFAQLTINRRNWQEIPETVRFLADKVQGFTFQFHYPYPEAADLFLPLTERAPVLDALLDLKRQGYPIMNSAGTLQRMRTNAWRCHDWLLADVDPDGSLRTGCYLKGRGEADCGKCGFAAHVELSLAYDWHPGAVLAGLKIFGLRPLMRLPAGTSGAAAVPVGAAASTE
ncbi:MAG: radical SAM protein [Chloroflexi bacterium]|nr:radical SAM protein [Chloroflexota bacterium]